MGLCRVLKGREAGMLLIEVRSITGLFFICYLDENTWKEMFYTGSLKWEVFPGIEVYMPIADHLFIINILILEGSSIWASELAMKVLSCLSCIVSILVFMFSVFVFLGIN